MQNPGVVIVRAVALVEETRKNYDSTAALEDVLNSLFRTVGFFDSLP